MVSDFLQLLFGNSPEELWVLVWTLVNRHSDWYQIKNISKAGKHSGKPDIYIGCCLSETNNGPKKRCEADSVAGLIGLWADIDTAGAAHKKAKLPPTIADAQALVESMPLPPSLLVFSGHGVQPWWLFKETWITEHQFARDEAATLEDRWLALLRDKSTAKGWELDSVQDLARVLRLPGTLNNKLGDGVPVTFAEMPGRPRYDPEDFRQWVERPKLGNGQPINKAVGSLVIISTASPPFHKWNRLMQDKKFKASWERQRKDLKDSSPSGYDMSLATMAVLDGWTDQEICDLLVAGRIKNQEDPKLREDYYRRTITGAKETASRLQAFDCIDEVIQRVEESTQVGANGERAHAEAELYETLNSLLGFRIRRLVKYQMDPDPEFILESELGNLMLGTAASILNIDTFRSKIASLTAGTAKTKVIKIDKALRSRWQNIAEILFRITVIEGAGEDCTHPSRGIAWLRGYVNAEPFAADRDGAIEGRIPFRENGSIGFFGDSLRKWLNVETPDKRISAREMGIVLRACGCKPIPTNMKKGDRHVTRTIWWIQELTLESGHG